MLEKEQINTRRFLRHIDYIYSFFRRIFYIQRCNYMHIYMCVCVCVCACAYIRIYACKLCVHVVRIACLTYVTRNSN